MKLSELLKKVSVMGDYSDCDVCDITSDTRKVKSGVVFVCICGANFDGHNAAVQAEQDGATAVVAERPTGAKNEVLVEDTRQAYALMCAAYNGYPTDSLKLIGLTGTNGKTTTTFLIKSVLENAGKKVGLIGTIQNMVCEKVYPASYTTPDAYELQGLFRLMKEAGCEYCVMEVSSQALAQGRCFGLHFDIGLFTNLTQDHLDYHKTMENYKAAKHILFENCDTAIVNCDDYAWEDMVKDTDCKVVTYSAKNDRADFVAKNIVLKSSGISYELLGDGEIGRIKCMIPGTFTVYNSLAAACTAIEAGVEFSSVVAAFPKAHGIKGRIEVVPTDTDYTVIIDYAHSPDGLENILTSLKEFAVGRVITVFGCGGDRDKTKRPKMADIAARLSDFVVVTSDNPRTEDPEAIVRDVCVGLKGHKTAHKVIVNRTEAIRFALENAEKDDIVLLAGKGHETYQIIGTVKNHYDEREIVAGILNGDI